MLFRLGKNNKDLETSAWSLSCSEQQIWEIYIFFLFTAIG